jgi:hypothetical protein
MKLRNRQDKGYLDASLSLHLNLYVKTYLKPLRNKSRVVLSRELLLRIQGNTNVIAPNPYTAARNILFGEF